MPVYLYDSSGDWVAFRSEPNGRYLFDRDSEWIGWFPWADEDVAVTPDGDYLGTVVENRLLRSIPPVYHAYPGYPGAPSFPGRAAYPGSAPYAGYISGFEDVAPELLTTGTRDSERAHAIQSF